MAQGRINCSGPGAQKHLTGELEDDISIWPKITHDHCHFQSENGTSTVLKYCGYTQGVGVCVSIGLDKASATLT